ncbi:threonine aspartase 1-like [Prorops nasuta]|uniref:threonine aspartase 1-like n=1 Tax=Prorops nasuta TaxID=863751 RepID=UPI0034CD116B
MNNSNQGFVAVHVGAGHHSDYLIDKYKQLCKEACKIAVENINCGATALDAVVESVIVLENSQLTNAGYGSNLTLNGTVECDASVMDGATLKFGAVGAVSGVKNPALLAKRLCQQQSIDLSLGRIQPSFLVGNGAHVWAREMGIEILPPEELISVKARELHKHYKRKIDNWDESYENVKKRMDTVGAVCVDKLGNVASVCSSGGLILKYPGRVGQAGVWGCGVWASKDRYCVGASTSGCGEHLVRTTLARTVAEAIENSSCPTTSLHLAMKTNFIESRFIVGLNQKLGGVIAIKYNPEDELGEFLWAHSTETMVIGYMNSNEKSPMSHMTRLSSQDIGKTSIIGGVSFKLSNTKIGVH